jgi:hypothetical protein
MSEFKAKRIKPNRYALFEDAVEFAQLTQVSGKWLLSTANAELKRLFDGTHFRPNSPITSVLWAIRAILDHLREIAARLAEANETETRLAEFAKTFEPVVNPRDGRVTFAPRNAVLT